MNVLITGASAGIGRELAYLHAEQGHHLLLVGRNVEQLFETKHFVEQRGGSAVVLPYDIGQTVQIEALLRATENIPVDILINNAGFGLYGEFVETDLSRELNMIDVNIRALTHLTKAFARGMKVRGSGRIIQIASTSSFHGGPFMSVYYATKAYVLSFSEALADELAPYNIQVTAVCPGATYTDFAKTADLATSGLFKRPGIMDANTVAKLSITGYMKGKTLVIPGRSNAVYVFMTRFFTRRKLVQMTHQLQAPTHSL
ncbi:SDR family oxidoreductase [Exiguobacterium sp. s166]|uniref:SDR family NAD(P)-dependent oxidoreductase n=1 Tax=Exiguobacterium sp. s166 TaxID=2751204 RepID=UPI001BEB2E74|nr:SDR family oxidoreductase [Exiguobacterium sp. s166]